jgi:hypothetical protein
VTSGMICPISMAWLGGTSCMPITIWSSGARVASWSSFQRRFNKPRL